RWVQMHIISDKLGGSGDLDANLIPAPNSVNRGPFFAFEQKTVELAKAKSGKVRNNIWVSVSVGGSKTAASSISGQAGLYLWKGKKASPKWLKSPAATLSASVGVPKPNLTGPRKFSLNYTSPKVMIEEFGVSPATASLIYQGRPYKSMPGFETAMLGLGATAGQIIAVRSRSPVLND
ncbi:MAG TPA: DNA/RNA non-specific endonuclease, partial [Phenylobacterium sp.]|nr:DNA/RNA non-specific endonuclease [Phenylobacterium sp.]